MSMMQVAICLVIPQCMHLSGTVMEIWRFKDNGVMTLTFWGRRYRSRDHSTRGGPLRPCVYLAPLMRHNHLKFFQEEKSVSRRSSIL